MVEGNRFTEQLEQCLDQDSLLGVRGQKERRVVRRCMRNICQRGLGEDSLGSAPSSKRSKDQTAGSKPVKRASLVQTNAGFGSENNSLVFIYIGEERHLLPPTGIFALGKIRGRITLLPANRTTSRD